MVRVDTTDTTCALVAVGDGSSPRGGNSRSKSVIIPSPRAGGSDVQQQMRLVRKCESPIIGSMAQDEESSSSIPLPLPLSLSLSVGHPGSGERSVDTKKETHLTSSTSDGPQISSSSSSSSNSSSIGSNNAPADLSMVGAKLTLQNLRVCGLSTSTSLISVPISEIVHSGGLTGPVCCGQGEVVHGRCGSGSCSSTAGGVLSHSSHNNFHGPSIKNTNGGGGGNSSNSTGVSMSRIRLNPTESIVSSGSSSSRRVNSSSSSASHHIHHHHHHNNNNNNNSGGSNSFKFACHICGHEYPRESTLRNHLKVYHKIELTHV